MNRLSSRNMDGGNNISQTQLNINSKYDELKTTIVNDVVIPNLEHDARILSVWRIRWRVIANFFEALVKIMVGISTVLAYSSGYYAMPVLAYFAGLTGTIALVFGEFSSYCKKESHERTNLFNRLLSYLNISPIPDTTEDENSMPKEHSYNGNSSPNKSAFGNQLKYGPNAIQNQIQNQNQNQNVMTNRLGLDKLVELKKLDGQNIETEPNLKKFSLVDSNFEDSNEVKSNV